jgi:hypothetical protein
MRGTRCAVSEEGDNQRAVAPPSATGNAGASFEAKVGAFYLLALLTTGEPRGLPAAVARSVQFQGAADDRPFDDVIVKAMNADGSSAVLEVQAKRTMDFTATDPEFRDVVSRLWVASQLPEFRSIRYEMAVAIARTSTQIERPYQEVLHWARRHISADVFHRHLNLSGYASEWPDAGLVMELKGILPGESFSREGRRDLRNVGMPTPLNVDGRTIVGKGCLTLAGTSAMAQNGVGRLTWSLGEFLHRVADNPNHVADILRDRGEPVPEQLDLHFEFFETGGYGIMDTQAGRIVRLG